MATSKKSTASRSGRGGAPSKAAASRGGRASAGAKKAAAPKKAVGAKKTAAPKKASAPKKAAPKKAVSKQAAPKKAAAKKSAPSKAPAKKATASRSASAGTARGRGGAASSKAPAARSGRGAASKGTASRGLASGRGASSRSASARGGRSNASASRGRGAQQSTDPRNDLDKLMRDGLKDIYYAEKKLVTALGKMSKQAMNEELKAALDTHRTESEQQVSMLEDAFAALGEKVKGVKCAAMDGILEEATEHMGEYGKGPARDASIIVSAQKAEHYEIASYGTLATFAKALGYDEAKNIFGQILDQEKATDEKLSTLADRLNQEALRAHNETDEDSDNGGSSNNSEAADTTSEDSGGNSRGSDVSPVPEETLDITA